MIGEEVLHPGYFVCVFGEVGMEVDFGKFGEELAGDLQLFRGGGGGEAGG